MSEYTMPTNRLSTGIKNRCLKNGFQDVRKQTTGMVTAPQISSKEAKGVAGKRAKDDTDKAKIILMMASPKKEI
jgi:hypothetical protein